LRYIKPVLLALGPGLDGGMGWEWNYVEADKRQQIQDLLEEGVTQAEIATTVGVTPGYVSRMKKEFAKQKKPLNSRSFASERVYQPFSGKSLQASKL
jgi:IS30 family transposase